MAIVCKGLDEASADPDDATDDQRIYHGYCIGRPNQTPTHHLVIVNWGYHAAKRSVDDCLVALSRLFPSSINALSFCRVCSSKTCITFNDLDSATKAFTVLASPSSIHALGRTIKCAYSHVTYARLETLPRVAVTWATYLKRTTALSGHTTGGSGTKECSHTRTPTTATTTATTATTTTTTPVLPTIPHVPGLSLVLDAFSIEEERLLVQEIHNHGEQGHGATSNATGKQLSNETTGWSTCARKEARESNTFSTHAHRRVMHFGHRFDYDTRGVGRPATGGTLPPFLQPVVARIQQYCGKNTKEEQEQDQEGEELFDQCTVNEYQSGHGISAHVGKSTRGRQCCSFLTRY